MKFCILSHIRIDNLSKSKVTYRKYPIGSTAKLYKCLAKQLCYHTEIHSVNILKNEKKFNLI